MRTPKLAWLAFVVLGGEGCMPPDGGPGSSHQAATGDILRTINFPAEAQCPPYYPAEPFSVPILSNAVAMVPTSVFDLTISTPMLLATSCVTTDTSTAKGHQNIYFTNPVDGSYVATLPTSGATSDFGWSSFALRGDKGDLIGCTHNIDGHHDVYKIDILTGVATHMGSVEASDNSGGFAWAEPCDGLAWDSETDTVYQGPDISPHVNVYPLNSDDTLNTGAKTSFNVPADADDGNSTCLKSGLYVSGQSIFISCDTTQRTLQLDKTTHAFITSYDQHSLRGEDLECDPFTFAAEGKTALWTKEGRQDKVYAFEVPRNTCNLAGTAVPPQPAPQTGTCCSTGDLDSDHDGLLDCWEIAGSINFDCTGAAEYTFPGGVDAPNYLHKDLYIELDYTTGFTPFSTALAAVRTAFANATTVSNPAGGPGISVHFVDGSAVGATGSVHFASQCSDMSTGTSFDTLKASNFGTSANQAAKGLVFRYGLIVNSLSNHPYTMGCAEVPGDDFVIAADAFLTWDSDSLAGVLMHELGHNLNRRHGGSNNRDTQANFVSVMNSAIILPDINASRALNFSVFQTSWSEVGMVERAGIPQTDSALNPVQLQTAYWNSGYLGGTFRPALTKETLGTDYNNNGSIETVAYSSAYDMDQDGIPGNPLPGGEDWSQLVLDFRTAYDYASGIHLSTLSMEEELPNTFHLENSGDDDGDGVPNVADNCILTANFDQTDANHNGIGDACEIIPSVCIIHPGDRDDIRAVFSYDNPNLQQSYPIGPENFLSPSVTIDQGAQPTVFTTGSHGDVFQVVFDHKTSVTWTVGGRSATADNNTPNCKFHK